MSKPRGANYKPQEDKVLCQAWLTVSCDPIVVIFQTGDDFYGKVKAAFDTELRLQDAFVADRTAASLASRFLTISHAVSKFVACHTTVVAYCASGRSPLDIEHDAVALYEAKNGTFKFMQCWHVLRESPKWGAWRSSNDKRKMPKKRQRGEVESGESDTTAPSPSDDTLSPDEQRRAPTTTETPSTTDDHPQGASKAKTERANLALYARQVKAAERTVANAEMRIKVAQDQLDISLFSIPGNPDDPLTAEFLLLKKQAALKRLRAELQAVVTQETDVDRPLRHPGRAFVNVNDRSDVTVTPSAISTPDQTGAVV